MNEMRKIQGLKDADLFRQAALIGGDWVQADDGATVDVPMGYCEFPTEIVRPPRSLAERTFTDIRRWSVMPHGGHFAAMEVPEDVVADLRVFFG